MEISNKNFIAFFGKTMEFTRAVNSLGYGMGGMFSGFRTCPSPDEVERMLNEKDLRKITHSIIRLWDLGYRDIKPELVLEVIELGLNTFLTDKSYHKFGLFKQNDSCKTKLKALQDDIIQTTIQKREVNEIRSRWCNSTTTK